MGVVEREEHQRIYKSTGLDIDNRLESLDHVTELMDSDIRHIIAFLKTIPGFRTFSLPDQTALVKGGCDQLFSSFFLITVCINRKLLTVL